MWFETTSEFGNSAGRGKRHPGSGRTDRSRRRVELCKDDKTER